jgi:predicted unusual protein kinase regulating ubiquinone biosynthesis (AarF/ABC1/UbiB family)
MVPKLDEVIAAIPAFEDDEEPAAHDPLREALAGLAGRPAPGSALGRLWAFGGLEAQIALAYGRYFARAWFVDADQRELELAEAHLRTALKMVRTMGYLRGAAMKLGQTLANYPDLLPDQIVETLERLHFDAPPMHFALLREHVRNELGRDPEEVFATFDPHAFAAASLGQVHRAVMKSGETVAVKIQYPAIGRTIRADFRNLSALLLPLRLGREIESLKAQVEEIHRVIEQETDYVREAEMQRRARALIQEDDELLVPRVHDAFSTRRVLTMEYLDGVHIQAFLASNPSQELRDHYGRLIYLAGSRLHFAGRLLYADPHPGNYLFRPDGRLGLLDFGCVRPYTEQEWECCRLADSAMPGNNDDLVRVARSSLGLAEGESIDLEVLSQFVEFARWMWRPYAHDGAFDFGDARYLREGVDRLAATAQGRTVTPNVTLYAFLLRWYFGVVAMLYRLRARVDVKAIDLRERAASGWRPA